MIAGGLLFCEGKTDIQALRGALGASTSLLTLVPTTGKRGMWAYIRGYLAARYPEGAEPPYLVFRDRDFDREPGDEPELIPWDASTSSREGVFLVAHRDGMRVSTERMDADLLGSRFDAYEEKFEATAFWDEKRYMAWFHGKDLRKAMNHVAQDSREELGAFGGFPLKTYCRSGSFPRASFDRFPDLAQLKKEIELRLGAGPRNA